jgi:hypothetical protein
LSTRLKSSQSSSSQNNKLSDRFVWHLVLFRHWLSQSTFSTVHFVVFIAKNRKIEGVREWERSKLSSDR